MCDHEKPRNVRRNVNPTLIRCSIRYCLRRVQTHPTLQGLHVCLWANPNGRQPCWHIFICPTSPAALRAGIGFPAPSGSLARHVGKLLCNSKMRQTMDGQTRTPRTGPSERGRRHGRRKGRVRPGKAEALMRAQYFVTDAIDTKEAVLT